MSSIESTIQTLDPLIRSVIQRKMRVRLDPRDGREMTQRAWDCYQNVYLELVEKLQGIEAGQEEPIQNLEAYVRALTSNTISDELRRGNKDRTRLKARLRYFLSQQPAFALWAGSDERFWCGLSGWPAQRAVLAPGARVATLAPMPVKPLELMKTADWRDLLDGIFTDLDGPVWLDTLVAILAPWFGITSVAPDFPDDDEEDVERTELPSPQPGPEQLARAREWLKWVWDTMASFDRRWLIAYFLNLPMDNRTKERGEIQVFPAAGIASIGDIGKRLALSPGEYAILKRELAQNLPSGEEISSPELRLAALWQHLPLADDCIGAMLGLTRQQVANLRMTASAKLNKLWDENAAKPARRQTTSIGGGTQ
jgi:hypothetical protein